MADEKMDMETTKEAATSIAGMGLELLQGMGAKEAFHAILSGAVIFGGQHFGRQQVAAWLRTVADSIDRPDTLN